MEIKEYLESEGVTEAQLWDASEIQDVPSSLEPELRTDVPGMEKAIVYGDPIFIRAMTTPTALSAPAGRPPLQTFAPSPVWR